MNKNIEELRSKYDLMKAEEQHLLDGISSVRDKQKETVRELCQQLTEQYSRYLNKKVTVEGRRGTKLTGFFSGFTHGHKDTDFEAFADLAQIKKDGTPSAVHYKYYDSVMYTDNFKITLV